MTSDSHAVVPQFARRTGENAIYATVQKTLVRGNPLEGFSQINSHLQIRIEEMQAKREQELTIFYGRLS